MPNSKRLACESEIYHLTARGVGRMNIFEDDGDYFEFMRMLTRAFQNGSIDLFAWCLMSNHVHLLVHGALTDISGAMKSSLSVYASFFNAKHGHAGHVFQGRFGSVPIIDDGQLISAVRYIHLNPEEAGICSFTEYQWSSYREYLGEAEYVDPSKLLELLGGLEQFLCLHAERGEDPYCVTQIDVYKRQVLWRWVR